MANEVLVDHGPASKYTVEIHGKYAVVFYGKTEKARFYICAQVQADLDAYYGRAKLAEQEVESEGGESPVKLTIVQVDETVEAYKMLQKKHIGRFTKYNNKSKSWKFFKQATALRLEFELDAPTYVMIFMKHYSKVNSEEKFVIPWPAQLQGEYARHIIMQYLASNKAEVPEVIKARKLAQSRKWMAIEKDSFVEQSRARIKARTHTVFDIEYLKARYIQKDGDVPEWLTKLDNIMNGKPETEAKADDE